MAEHPSSRWYETIPGLLTALAATLTAITGLIIALQQTGVIGQRHRDSTMAKADAVVRPEVAPAVSGSSALTTPSPIVLDYRRPLGSDQHNGDVVQIVSISPTPGTRLKAGETVRFDFRVRYTLASADTALLYAHIAQSSRASATDCDGSDELVNADFVPVGRGSGEVDAFVVWKGGASKGPPPSAGRVAPTFSLWEVAHRERLSSFPVVKEACYPFSK